MITFLKGSVDELHPTHVVVDVHGVGYELLIPLSSHDRLPRPGQPIHLFTHLVVREDAHTLYGFATRPERELFQLLINTVSGIGPRMALSILSGMSPAAFRSAVASADLRALSQISGVGRKTAERIVLELKDKLGSAPALDPSSPSRPLAPDEQVAHDAVLALTALGYKPAEALETVRATQAALGAPAPVEEIVRLSLKKRAS